MMVLLKSWPSIFKSEAVAWAVSETPDILSFFCTGHRIYMGILEQCHRSPINGDPVLFRPSGSNTFSFAILLATAPPCSSARAPTMAKIACAYTMSAPDALSDCGCFQIRALELCTKKGRTHILGHPPHDWR